MDGKIIGLKKKMLDYDVKPVDLVNWFGWTWTYVSNVMRGRQDISDNQVRRIESALPKIKSKKGAA